MQLDAIRRDTHAPTTNRPAHRLDPRDRTVHRPREGRPRPEVVLEGFGDAGAVESLRAGIARACDGRLAAQPARRFAGPDELAQQQAFPCTDAVASTTGAMMPVDGGWTAH
jgi:NAD(P)-dependent dehydrogenase (short-subunit alcohol dehydrogenase family)